MIISRNGYHTLIEYLTDNLSLFEQGELCSQDNNTIRSFVRYQLVEQMSLIFEQHKEFSVDEKIAIVAEFDHVFSDLSEVLGRLLEHNITEQQRAFIIDYFSLLKNLFDTQFEST